MQAVGGSEVVRVLIIPNLADYSRLLSDGIDDSARRPAAERVLNALVAVLASLRDSQATLANGHPAVVTEELRSKLTDKVGDLIATRIAEANEVQLAHIIVEA